MNEIFLYTYSSNGLKLGKISVQLKLPITIIPQTDEMIIFSVANIYFAKVALNEKASLIAISKNLEISDIDSNLEEAEKLEKQLSKNKFDLDDYLAQLRQVKKMGSFSSCLKMLPGANKLKDIDIDDKEFDKIEAIITSMTAKERKNPNIFIIKNRQLFTSHLFMHFIIPCITFSILLLSKF